VYAQLLYERHSARIFGFCIRRLRTREEAEDAVQTTFLQALGALRRGVVPISETAWLFTIAANVCRCVHRANSRRQEHELVAATNAGHHADDVMPTREAGVELLRALATITESQRKAFLLREWRGLTYREISAELGVSLASVETLIFRARRGMARALDGARTHSIEGSLAGYPQVRGPLRPLAWRHGRLAWLDSVRDGRLGDARGPRARGAGKAQARQHRRRST
jgi:RNA polymerase sigma-70 factor (ECF subfamily)